MKTWPEQKAAEVGLPKPKAQKLRKAWLQEVADRFPASNIAAQHIGMRVNGLHRMARLYGVTMPKGPRGFQSWVCMDQFRELAAQNMTAGEIAAEVGCTREHANKIARENGIRLHREPRSSKRNVVTKQGPKPLPPEPGNKLPAGSIAARMAKMAAQEVAYAKSLKRL